MSFYRTILAAFAAVALTTPVFADDTSSTTPASTDTNASMSQSSTDTSNANATQGTTGTQQAAATTETEKLNINKATAKELMKVKGMNAAKARAIVSYRKKHGDFKSLDELSNVKGFKKMKPDAMKEMEDQLTVE